MVEVAIGIMFLAVLALIIVCIHGGIDRTWCIYSGGHDWEWQNNTTFSSLTVYGRYKCRKCNEWSDGCARHEQRTREIDPADHDIRGNGQANFAPIDWDEIRRDSTHQGPAWQRLRDVFDRQSA